MKSGLDFFSFEILHAPSEIPANLPGQFSRYGQISLHWAAATLKGHIGFQNKKNLDHFSPSFFSQNQLFQELRFQSTYSSRSRWCAGFSKKWVFAKKNRYDKKLLIIIAFLFIYAWTQLIFVVINQLSVKHTYSVSVSSSKFQNCWAYYFPAL